MVISFKDQTIENRLSDISKEQRISPSLIARRDLARWYWLLDDHDAVPLEQNEFQAISSIVKSTQSFEEPSRIKQMASLIEDALRSATLVSGEYGKVERFGVDVNALCTKLRTATPLQLAGLVARAEAYPSAKLWSRKEIEPNLIDILIDGMEAALNAQYQEQIEDFLQKHDVSKWIIASDYSMNRPEFTHDAMAFVLIPYKADIFPPAEIEKHLPIDFKDCGKTVDVTYISYLRSAPAFSFVFLLDRSQKLFSDAELAAQALQRSLAMMKGWPNATEPQNAEMIRKAELSLREAKTTSFLRKVNDVTMLSLLGAFVGMVATRKRKLDGILWAPDRDNMTGVWEGLSSALFQANLHSALHRRKMPEMYTVGIAGDARDAGKLWFDAYIRLADYLATPAAAMTRREDGAGKFDKCNQIVREVFADNPQLVVQRWAFLTENGLITPDCRLMRFSKNPFPQPAMS